MKVTCKCHGVSGSCSLVTCWQQLSPFRKVGDLIVKKYKGASRVKVARNGRLRIRRRTDKVPTANDLIYLERSPDYCHRNDTIGTTGEGGGPAAAALLVVVASVDLGGRDCCCCHVVEVDATK